MFSPQSCFFGGDGKDFFNLSLSTLFIIFPRILCEAVISISILRDILPLSISEKLFILIFHSHRTKVWEVIKNRGTFVPSLI